MNHNEAVGTKATERYLLHELPDDERDEFEEHYFDCAVCADDVQSGSAFVQTLPFVLPTKPVKAPLRGPWSWNYTAQLATAASLMVVLTLAFAYTRDRREMQRTIAEMRQPHVASYLRLQANRGDQAAQVPSSRKPLVLDVLVPPGSPTYVCHFVDATGTIRHSLPVTAAQAQNLVRIEVPAGTLLPGSYTLRVDGRQPRIVEYPFTVE